MNNTLVYFSKPLLLFSLLSFFLHKVSALYAPLKLAFVIGLLSSLAGDVFLMFDATQNFFLMGVGAFMLAQLAYSIFFLKNSTHFKPSVLLIASLPIIGSFYLLNQVFEVPEELVLPVNVYAIALSAMLISALNYARQTRARSSLLMGGAFIFVLSDLFLAYSKFGLSGESSMYLQMIIMTTYAIAQFLLATSVIARIEHNNKELHSGSTS
jgi:uncharacterized membrane protein YhhN